ncbi:copper chaperone PCu(A)C [Ruegeria sp. Ofav3-42]|uniref:copper chaperone PCu(A)C n=1 Tax=Ruegeria sp. Ofav3-42 TaxID=2917759 RepID=UPI001EF50E02|nr:copper chaperone PCu(A)C [Ruegeria sp. Ofav3-42]MCG7518802.1 copper chaperone PCu(A)C [Ruegeria sp. Ofav3-42]
MSLTSKLLATLAAATLATAAFAQDTITVDDAYARSSGKTAKAGAAFMMIQNTGDADDRLIGVQSDAAARVELHTHIVDENGVAKMTHVEDGFAIPAGETHMLKRGGDHVMFMGLTAPFEQGGMVPVKLIFENAGEVEVEIPVDLERQDAGGHGTHSH